MDLLENLDTAFNWDQMDMVSNINPSLLNHQPTYGPQQVNVSSAQGSLETVVATPNQVQNSEHTFDFPGEATSSSMGNLPQLLVDDCYQLPQLSQNSSAPLLDETQSGYYVPSMVGLMPEGAGSSSVQQGLAEMTPMECYNQFSLLQDNNLPMMHNMGQHNELNNTNNQMLMPNILANQNFNGMISNQQPSTYPAIFEQNPVEAGVGNEITNGHFMTNQTSPFDALNNHAINPQSAWNSSGSHWVPDQGNEYNPLLDIPGFDQQQTSTFNDLTALNSGFGTSSILNSGILGLPGSGANEGSSSQMFNMEAPQMESRFRPENSPGMQLQQMPPLSNSVNTITPLGAESGLPIYPPSFGAQPPVPIQNMLNQNDRSMVTSYGPYATLQQNPSQNAPSENREPTRRGRPRKQFEPGSICAPYKRRKKGSSSSSKGKAGKTSASQVNNDAAAPLREVVEAPLYDIAFERAGLPRDPFLRFFKLLAEKSARLAATKEAPGPEE